jgi:hypothetical protein
LCSSQVLPQEGRRQVYSYSSRRIQVPRRPWKWYMRRTMQMVFARTAALVPSSSTGKGDYCSGVLPHTTWTVPAAQTDPRHPYQRSPEVLVPSFQVANQTEIVLQM